MHPLKHFKILCTGVIAIAGFLCSHTDAMGYTLEPYRWDATSVPIYFRFSPGAYNGAFNSAMQRWNAVNPAVRLNNGSHIMPQTGVGTICAPDSTSSNGATFAFSVCGKAWEEGVLAVTLVSYDGNGIARHGALVFNSRIPYALYNGPVRADSFDFGRVVLHELGHFLGLNHENRLPAIMQPRISNIDNLTTDDREGIKVRYQD